MLRARWTLVLVSWTSVRWFCCSVRLSLSTLTGAGAGVTSGEGYFAAIENRGIVQSGEINDFTEMDVLITELDKQGAAPEYAMYVNTSQALAIDDMVASLNGAAGFASATVVSVLSVVAVLSWASSLSYAVATRSTSTLGSCSTTPRCCLALSTWAL
jgi:hypothetical protein